MNLETFIIFFEKWKFKFPKLNIQILPLCRLRRWILWADYYRDYCHNHKSTWSQRQLAVILILAGQIRFVPSNVECNSRVAIEWSMLLQQGLTLSVARGVDALFQEAIVITLRSPMRAYVGSF